MSTTPDQPRMPAPGFGPAVAVLVGLAVVVAAGAVTAIYAPLELGDPGPVVRWLLPLASVVRDISMSAVVGLLGLSVFVVPERRDTDRRRRAGQLASAAAAVWFAAALLVLVTTFADVSGTPIGSAGFASQFRQFVWDLEFTRALLLNAVAAAAVAAFAALARTRAATSWVFVLTVTGVLVLALTGHAAGSADHETAVNSLAVHLLAATVWLGGLVGLALLRPALGRDLGVSVSRSSVVALWCYVAVALSGIQQAWLRLGSVSTLFTAYGLLVGLKVAALVVLGLFGWRQRTNLTARLRGDGADGGVFARLVVTELGVLGAAIGLGVALSRSAPPDAAPTTTRVQDLTGYPDPGPMQSLDWVLAWRVDWLMLGLALLMIGLYAAGVRRLWSRGDAWPALRFASWTAGWLLFLYATNGALDIWGRVQFSMHMVMHMVVAMFVPLLLVPAAPITLLLRAVPPRTDKTWGAREFILAVVHSRAMRVLSNPVVAAALFFISLAIFYFSPTFGLALTTHTGHLLMMAHFFLTGYLFTWVLIGIDPGPRRWSPLILLVVLFATISFHAFFGVVLTGSQRLLAPDFFQNLQLPWLTDPWADQVMAGEIAWGVGELPTLILALLVARQWLRSDRATQVRLDRQADRDGDADLVAYNTMLAERRAHFEHDGTVPLGEGNADR